MTPIRILQILPALNFCGGIENYLINYYRNLDKNIIQFDFITHTNIECSFREEILEMGGKIYEFPPFSLSSLPNILKRIDSFLYEHAGEYNIIHCHMANAACFYFWKARNYNIKNLILHSHQPSASDLFSHKIRNYPLLILSNLLATERIACTKLAGDFLFKHRNYHIIRNAIQVDRFLFNQKKREDIRLINEWENKIVIGHIGRFCAQKNQIFLLKVFKELLNLNNKYRLVLIGQGEDEILIDRKSVV